MEHGYTDPVDSVAYEAVPTEEWLDAE